MRLIVGIDGSETAMKGLDEVVTRAQQMGDEVTVAVYAPDDSLAAVETTVRARLDELGFEAEIEPIEDDPGSRLVHLAETGEYDRIVLSGGKTSPLGKIQLGTVTEFVLLNSHTSVTLIR